MVSFFAKDQKISTDDLKDIIDLIEKGKNNLNPTYHDTGICYLLKVNVAFVLFYAFYRLFFYKDTFFKLRRAILLAFFGLALFYPLLNIQDWVRQQEPIADVIYMYSAMLPEATAKADAAASVDWYGWLLGSWGLIYWGIVSVLMRTFSRAIKQYLMVGSYQ